MHIIFRNFVWPILKFGLHAAFRGNKHLIMNIAIQRQNSEAVLVYLEKGNSVPKKYKYNYMYVV